MLNSVGGVARASEGRVHQGRLEVRIVFFHSVCGIVEDKCLEGVELVRRSKAIPSPWVPEDWDSLELSTVTAGEGRKGNGEKEEQRLEGEREGERN